MNLPDSIIRRDFIKQLGVASAAALAAGRFQQHGADVLRGEELAVPPPHRAVAKQVDAFERNL